MNNQDKAAQEIYYILNGPLGLENELSKRSSPVYHKPSPKQDYSQQPTTRRKHEHHTPHPLPPNDPLE